MRNVRHIVENEMTNRLTNLTNVHFLQTKKMRALGLHC